MRACPTADRACSSRAPVARPDEPHAEPGLRSEQLHQQCYLHGHPSCECVYACAHVFACVGGVCVRELSLTFCIRRSGRLPQAVRLRLLSPQQPWMCIRRTTQVTLTLCIHNSRHTPNKYIFTTSGIRCGLLRSRHAYADNSDAAWHTVLDQLLGLVCGSHPFSVHKCSAVCCCVVQLARLWWRRLAADSEIRIHDRLQSNHRPSVLPAMEVPHAFSSSLSGFALSRVHVFVLQLSRRSNSSIHSDHHSGLQRAILDVC